MMISPDTSLLLSQDNDRLDRHRLWNLKTGELIRVFETSPCWFADSIANTSNGDCIVSGIRDHSLTYSPCLRSLTASGSICSHQGILIHGSQRITCSL
jgi:hypothetical protein